MTPALRYHGRMFTRREILAGATAATAQTMLSQAVRKPNIVLFLADDLGCHDLGAWGAADLQTPNIDSLASGGARFTNWYAAAPVCAGVPTNGPALRPSEKTIATVLKAANYA